MLRTNGHKGESMWRGIQVHHYFNQIYSHLIFNILEDYRMWDCCLKKSSPLLKIILRKKSHIASQRDYHLTFPCASMGRTTKFNSWHINTLLTYGCTIGKGMTDNYKVIICMFVMFLFLSSCIQQAFIENLVEVIITLDCRLGEVPENKTSYEILIYQSRENPQHT